MTLVEHEIMDTFTCWHCWAEHHPLEAILAAVLLHAHHMLMGVLQHDYVWLYMKKQPVTACGVYVLYPAIVS